jgi:hypothetical protein
VAVAAAAAAIWIALARRPDAPSVPSVASDSAPAARGDSGSKAAAPPEEVRYILTVPPEPASSSPSSRGAITQSGPASTSVTLPANPAPTMPKLVITNLPPADSAAGTPADSVGVEMRPVDLGPATGLDSLTRAIDARTRARVDSATKVPVVKPSAFGTPKP